VQIEGLTSTIRLLFAQTFIIRELKAES